MSFTINPVIVGAVLYVAVYLLIVAGSIVESGRLKETSACIDDEHVFVIVHCVFAGLIWPLSILVVLLWRLGREKGRREKL